MTLMFHLEAADSLPLKTHRVKLDGENLFHKFFFTKLGVDSVWEKKTFPSCLQVPVDLPSHNGKVSFESSPLRLHRGHVTTVSNLQPFTTA